jgi:hypothetical protein
MPLNPAECPLIPTTPSDSNILKVYEEFEAALRDAQQNMGNALAAEEIVAAEGTLAETKLLLERKRYLIGLFGPSGSGKSTSINRFLRMQLCGEGSGPAETSVPTRLRPNPVGTVPKVTRVYYTSLQFQRRRFAIATAIGLPPPAPPDDSKSFEKLQRENLELVTRLDSAQLARAHASPDDPKRDARGDDRQTLKRLLMSFNNYGQQHIFGTKPPDVNVGTIADLAMKLDGIVNHKLASPDEISPDELLREVIVDFPFPATEISYEIELIDLPGIGTTRHSDDITTFPFLSELDGALAFWKADSVQAGNLLDVLLGRASSPFWTFDRAPEPLEGRVWIIGTWAEGLGEAHLGYTGNGKTVFEGWAQHLDPFDLLPDYFLLLGNAYAMDLSRGMPAPEATRKHLTHLQFDSEGQPRLPDILLRKPEPSVVARDGTRHLRHMPYMRYAYEAVINDGGIGRLQDVIRIRLRQIVGRRIACHATNRLRQGVERFLQHVTDVGQAEGFQPEHWVRVGEWSAAAKYLAGDRSFGESLDPRYRELDETVTSKFTAVKRKLRKLFADLTKSGEVHGLRTLHRIHAEALQAEAHRVAPSAATSVKNWLKDQYHAVEATLAGRTEIQIDGFASPAVAFCHALEEPSANSPASPDPFARLAEDSFFPSDHGDVQALRFDEYVHIMKLQIDATCHAAAHQCARSCLSTLAQMRSRLQALSDQEHRDRPHVDSAVVQRISVSLRGVIAAARTAASALALSNKDQSQFEFAIDSGTSTAPGANAQRMTNAH